MILSDIKQYLKARRQASLNDLALHFGTDPDAMRGMLDQWISKGKVMKSELQTTCGRGCTACTCSGSLEIYEWRA